MDEPFENKDLSEREIEVLRLLAAGLSNKEIASQLVLSVNTVKVHLRNIFAKLGVQSRTEATLVAMQRGWVAVPTAPGAGPAPGEMLYAPVEPPQVILEPPLPMWQRWALIGAALAAIAGVVVSGAAAGGSAAASQSLISDSPNGVRLGQSVTGDSLWRASTAMPTARTRLAVVSHAGRLLAIGGDTQNGASAAAEWFDPLTGEWTAAAAKLTAVSNVSAVVISDTVIVPGGATASGDLTPMVEAYDVRRDEWSVVAPLPAPRMAYALAAFDRKVYLFGGWDGSAYSAQVFAYDPVLDAWSARAPMSGPRGFAAAAALGDAIYVVGGFDGQVESSVCERYRAAEDRWERCPSMSVGRGGLALVAIGDSLYAIGGGWTGYLAFNEASLRGSESWRPISTPFVGQWRGLGAGVVDAEIIAVGGWNGQYLAVTEQYSPFPFKVFVPATKGEGEP